MQYSTTPGTQGICPAGWHIPTDAELYTLENYLKDPGRTCSPSRVGVWDCASAGTKLKVGGSSGFNGVITGQRSPDGNFYAYSIQTVFWSSSEDNSSAVWYRNLGYYNSDVYRNFNPDKSFGFSVRCLKNQ